MPREQAPVSSAKAKPDTVWVGGGRIAPVQECSEACLPGACGGAHVGQGGSEAAGPAQPMAPASPMKGLDHTHFSAHGAATGLAARTFQ